MKKSSKRERLPDRPFYDVFISYRHCDAAAVEELAEQIEDMGYEVFVDSHFSGLNDPNEIKPKTIETIRRHIAKATCLIVAYSRESAMRNEARGEPVGVWLPWELGYFDGAMTSRIAVFLLDGHRNSEPYGAFYKGCEYLQLYEKITREELPAYLARMAARERRIDNTGSAFRWMEHMARECVANPANVYLGVAEWFADHAANWFRAMGNEPMAEAYARTKIGLDNLRVGFIGAWRVPLFDELYAGNLQSMVSRWMRQSGHPVWPEGGVEAQGVTMAPGPNVPFQQPGFKFPADLLADVERAIAAAMPNAGEAIAPGLTQPAPPKRH